MLQHTQQLYDFHVWANDQVFAHLEQLPKEAFHAEATSVFPSVAQTFGHMYLFEQLYLLVLAEVPNADIFPKVPVWQEEAAGKDLAEMRRLFDGVAVQYRELLRRTPDPDKAMTIEHPNYGSLDTHFSEILRHVVNHGTYHRGNITAMLRQQGHAGVPTDYLFYLLERQQGGRQPG
ncbi:damage-inducible protein DinB [Paenibacillus sp. IB182496]|uniref:Damage-inducible protein DinB n=1 Tax=Paenibacillus sabuli TaxID=2772509 RepID=A0A927BZG8_9BACL|nr:DinB family protein [Paenibacillus sabuli]MBD2848138.1 damage-inducible protein DinB [Paenibacillus sabuli]